VGLVNPPRRDWDLPQPMECECRAVNIVSSFRPCHEPEGVGTPLAHRAGEPQICVHSLWMWYGTDVSLAPQCGVRPTGNGVRERVELEPDG
jgi:hypothetical protein